MMKSEIGGRGRSNQSSVSSNQSPAAARVDAATGGPGATERVTSVHAIVEPGTEFSDSVKSWCGFVPEGTEGELLMREDCPEFSDRANPAPRIAPRVAAPRSPACGTPPCTQSACGGQAPSGAASPSPVPHPGREDLGQPQIVVKSVGEGKKGRRRGPKPQFTKELFERVWLRVARGERVGMAVRAEGMGTSRFYECVAARPLWAVALRRAREHKLPAHVSRRAVGRRVGGRKLKARFTMDLLEGDLSQLSDRMLMLLLKAAAPEKYGVATPRGKGECGMMKSEMGGMERKPESRCDFVPEDAGGEVLLRKDRPELSGRSSVASPRSPAPSGTPPCGEDKETGRRGDTETGRHAAIGHELGIKSGVAAPRTLYSLSAVRCYAARRWECGDGLNRRMVSFRKILGEKC